ncbi:HlyC/CorC family transporter [bacterium]|nr:HlyC/CorC family transporter [bacterium]
MMMGIISLIVLVFLFLGVIFFAAGEIGLTSLNKWTIKKIIDEKGKEACSLEAWIEKPNQLLTTMLVGGNLMVIAVSAWAANFALNLSSTMHWKKQLVLPVVTIITSFFVLLFGEIIPKVFTRYNAEKVSFLLIKPLLLIDKILNPVVGLLVKFTDLIVYLFGGRIIKQGNLLTEKEIRNLIDISQKDGILEKQEKEMIEGTLEFTDTVVGEVMIPLSDIVAIDSSKSSDEIIDLVVDMEYSRVPIFKDNVANIIGILYTRDLLYTTKNESLFVLQDIMRKVYFIEEKQKIGKLLKEFKKGNIHIAIVVDKDKKALGLVTIEDLIEEIFGEILDEYD